MEVELQHSAQQIKRLERCMNDLVSLLALPAIWIGGEPSQIVRTLLDALLGMLRLDLVYVRLNDPIGTAPIEIVRAAPSQERMAQPQEIGKALNYWLEAGLQDWPARIQNPVGDGDISIMPYHLGLQGEIGVIVAGSQRADFPQQTESLVLSVAANQAAIGLQEARLLSEQKRIANELDQRVAQRTADLSAANEELRKEVAERGRVEAALQLGERNLNLILNTMPAMVWSARPDGSAEFFNQRYLDYLGLSAEQAKDWGWTIAIHPDDLNSMAGAWKRITTSNRSGESEARLRRFDGEYRWFLFRANPLRDESGNIVKWYGTNTDIHDRKQSEDELRLSEARKTAILDSALDCIVTIDHEGSITEFNRAAERAFGYRRDEVLGKRLADVIIAPSFREKHRQGFARYLATGEARVLGKRVEMTAVRADGSEFPVELAISRIQLDGPPSFTGYLRDITERKQAEEELRRSEAFLAEGQRLSLTGSFSWRVDTDEFTFSEELHRIFEFEPDASVTLERIGARVHPEDIALLSDKIEVARSGGSDFEYEIRLQMPDGSVKYVRAVAYKTRDRDGRLEYIGAVQDVTQRRLSEEALSRVRSELAHVARVTSLGTLTASIAHEVNQPLSGIVTNASACLRMLAADPPNVSGASETARRTIRDANRASDVIIRLRSLFGKKDTSPETMNLNEATREVIALSLRDIQRNRVVLQAELADDLPPVTGDRVQLQQVILNLLLNASDAMTGIDDRPRQLVIRTQPEEGDRVRLSVQDAGVGLDPQTADKLFEAFYTTKNDGMGIGLSVSRSIIQSHQGRLWASPNEGPGATFSFSIPREPKGVTSALSPGVIGAPAATDAEHIRRSL